MKRRTFLQLLGLSPLSAYDREKAAPRAVLNPGLGTRAPSVGGHAMPLGVGRAGQVLTTTSWGTEWVSIDGIDGGTYPAGTVVLDEPWVPTQYNSWTKG